MTGSTPTIVNVGYHSTNYWVVSAGRSRLLIDLGWPGSMKQLQANLTRMDVPLGEIVHGVATHYHPDHAGLAGELMAAGMRLLVLESQRDEAGDDPGHFQVTFADSRRVLAGIGIQGEIIPTPGHSPDSVSIVLDDGSAFTGDLTPVGFATEDDAAQVEESWKRLRAHGARRIYPGHGPARPLPAG